MNSGGINLEDLLNEVVKKIESTGWKYEMKDMPSSRKIIKFEVPKERDTEMLSISSGNKELQSIIESEFEKFRFIKGFEAIWSAENKKIECEIDSYFNINRIADIITSDELCMQSEDDDEDNREGREIKLFTIKDIDISIGRSSMEFAVLSGIKGEMMPVSHVRERRETIKIENININTHDEAIKMLLKISNSLLFQLNNVLEMPISLTYERVSRRRRFMGSVGNYNKDKQAKITTLKYEYDNEPMSLYIYAKNTFNSPLNQFLSYYQCIEFYFSVYANIEAKKKIQKILKDPFFDPNVDHNITKILSAIKYNRSNEIGDEKSQLETVIRSSVDEQDTLKEFIISNDERKEFYDNNKGKKLSAQNINIKGKNIDIINEVAERIYDIRCRIVHKKANGDSGGLILPYSNEIKLLKHDIDIIEYIARNVLIVNSRSINI